MIAKEDNGMLFERTNFLSFHAKAGRILLLIAEVFISIKVVERQGNQIVTSQPSTQQWLAEFAKKKVQHRSP